MRPVDQFFTSVREVFARNRSTDFTEVGAVLLAVILVTVSVWFWAAKRRARLETSRQLATLATRAGLSAADLAYLRRIAEAADLTLLEVMTRLPSFERATAEALLVKVPPVRPVEGSGYERVRHLRKVLGFSPLPPHHWLISTRELIAGDRVTVSGHAGRVSEVNEASFAVELPAATPVALGGLGTVGTLAIARPDDSRYLARVRALAVDPPATPDGGRRFFFAHDERPQRQQDRAYVRVRVSATVTLRLLGGMDAAGTAEDPTYGPAPRAPGAGGAGESEAPLQTLTGTMVDVSAGGLSLKLGPREGEAPLARMDMGDWRHSRVLCSFELRDGQRFENLAGVVATVENLRPSGQGIRLRLAFTGLTEAQRDRLSAAVAAEKRAPPAPEGLARILPLEVEVEEEDDRDTDD
jgi:hypothetical protein